jgi:hypothetical protein
MRRRNGEASMMLRYFVPAPGEVVETRAAGAPDAIDHVLSVLSVHPGSGEPVEWLVGLDFVGALHFVPLADRAALSPRAQSQLAFHEVAGAPPRRLDVEELHVLALELLEQGSDAPGLDDPVYLYGRLYGPLPATPGMPIRAVAGQLTVTRSDVLDGLARGLAHPFVCTGSATAARCFGALVPGDRPEAVARGRGAVLVVPVMPADLDLPNGANEALVAQLLSDVLHAMQADLRAQGRKDGLAARPLPVPSRAAVADRLVQAGYTLEGAVAVKRSTALGGLVGMLGGGERVVLPAEADVDGFAALAREVLGSLPGWPSAQSTALAHRTCGHPPSPLRAASLGSARAQATPSPAAAPPATRPITPRASTPRSEWMQDFVQAHRSAGGGQKPRLTPAQKAVAPGRTPEWMKDFEHPEDDT